MPEDTPDQPTAKDKLLDRPDEPLPTTDEAAAQTRPSPADPRRVPPTGQGTDPKAGDIDRTA